MTEDKDPLTIDFLPFPDSPNAVELTAATCGRCGSHFVSGGCKEVAEIQKEALSAGWGIQEVAGERVTVCSKCVAYEDPLEN